MTLNVARAQGFRGGEKGEGSGVDRSDSSDTSAVHIFDHKEHPSAVVTTTATTTKYLHFLIIIIIIIIISKP